MSTAVVIPPPNSSSLLRRVPKLTARARQLLTAVNLHFAAVAALVVVNLFLIAHLVFAWQAVNASDPAALAQQRTYLRAAQIAARPLQGIDDKLISSTTGGNDFYRERLPYAFSQVLTELGALTTRSGVRYIRGQYTELPFLSGPNQLTQVTIDASISGDYRSVVGFINALERSRMFFVISSITLTGQQTGQVNLRLRLRTFLRAAGPNEIAGVAPSNFVVEPAPADASQGGAR